jgi:predicted extracellular nuclease
MSKKIKIATYNCENLFSRTKIFKEDEAKSLQLLAAVSKLQQELIKPVFDQEKLAKLKQELTGYVSINDIRFKHTKPGIGALEWFGWIDFEKTPADSEVARNLARVITDVDADIICLIEVENRTVLQKFHDDILYKQFLKPAGKDKYNHIMLIDGNDDRGIDQHDKKLYRRYN